MFGTLIALLRDGVPVLGVIDQPITKERWLGIQGRPTTLNGEQETHKFLSIMVQRMDIGATGFTSRPET